MSADGDDSVGGGWGLTGIWAAMLIAWGVWAVRQRECYCCRGTYATLVFAGAVLLFAFGPGIVLLYAREKHRRAKLPWGQAFECPKCRYDLRASIPAGSTTCPECGAAIPGYPPAQPNNSST